MAATDHFNLGRIKLIELVQQHHPHMGETEILWQANKAQYDFCLETDILRELLDIGNTTAGMRYYPGTSGVSTLNVLRIYNVWVDDVLIPRIVNRDAAMLIDDDEHVNADNSLSTPSVTSNERYWYPIRDTAERHTVLIDENFVRIGIVEKSTGTITRDDRITNYQSISESGLQIRIDASKLPTFQIGEGENYTDGPDASLTVPGHFVKGIVSKVISEGYKDPRNLKIDLAQFFDLEYEKMVKKAKNHVKSNYVSTGFVIPCDF
jgi:hypothetical protein